jgi:hypothetical protein
MDQARYYDVDYSKLQRKFGGLVVARHGKDVIASAETYSELVDLLEQRGTDRRELIIERVTRDDAICIL